MARQLRQEEYRPFEHAHQLDHLAVVVARDLGRYLANAPLDLLLGEEDPLDARGQSRAHASTGRSASPYLKTRFSKSF